MSKTSYNSAVLKVRQLRGAAQLTDSGAPVRTLTMYHGEVAPKHFIGHDGNRYVRLAPTRGIRVLTLHQECDAANFIVYKAYSGSPVDYSTTPMLETEYQALVEASIAEAVKAQKAKEASEPIKADKPKPVFRNKAVTKIIIHATK